MGFKTSIFSFVSGKFYLLKHLLPFPDHKIYVEVFGGSGVVLLNKKPCRVEVYNDINKEFVNFWLVLRDYNFFLRLFCEMMLDSRDVFEDFKKEQIDDKYILSIYSSFLDSLFARVIESTNDDKEIIEVVKQYKEIRKNGNANVLFELFLNKTGKTTSLKDAFTFFYNLHHSFIGTKSYDGIRFEDIDQHKKRKTFETATEQLMSLKDAFSFFYKMDHSFSYRGDSFNGISLTHEDARNKVREAFVEKVKEDEHFKTQFKNFQEIIVSNDKVEKAFNYFDIKGGIKDFSKISWIWNRIRNVHFENQDFRKIIPRVDREGVLIYCDPPYFKSPELCSNQFTVKDHEDLFHLLKDIKEAKFILSIDDRSYYECDKWFYQRVTRKNRAGSMHNDTQIDVEEWIISNFDRTKQENKPDSGYLKVI